MHLPGPKPFTLYTTLHQAHWHQCIFSGGIRTNKGICSYYESFEYDWSSYFLILAATKKASDTSLADARVPRLVQ
jgi:hypothetical protein